MTDTTCFADTFMKLGSTVGRYTCSELIIQDRTGSIFVEQTYLTFLAIDNVYFEDDDEKYTLNVDEFIVSGNDDLVTLDLKGIHSMVDSTIRIDSNPKLEIIDLSKLKEAKTKIIGKVDQHRLEISNNPALKTIKLDDLVSVEYFVFHQNTAMTTLSLPKLGTAEQLLFGTNDLLPPPTPVGPTPYPPTLRNAVQADEADWESLQTLSLPMLAKVTGRLEIAKFSKLKKIDLPQLQTVGEDGRDNGDLIIASVEVEVLDLQRLSRVEGQLNLQNLTSQEVKFPLLSDVGSLVVRDSHRLVKATFPLLYEVNGDLIVFDLDRLTALDFSRLQFVRGDFQLENLEKLETAELVKLQSIGPDADGNFKKLTVDNTLLKALELTDLRQVGMIYVRSNSDMETVFIGENLIKMTDGLVIKQNDKLTSVDMLAGKKGFLAGVVTVGEVTIELNEVLSVIGLNNIEFLQGNLTLYDNPVLQEITTNLQGVIGDYSYIIISDNTQLEQVDLLYLQQANFITDLKDRGICINNVIEHSAFVAVDKCQVQRPSGDSSDDDDSIGGGAIFGIIVAVFVGCGVALGGGYYLGKRSAKQGGYETVN